MFWPDQALKDAVACLAVLAAVLFLIVRPSLFGGSLTAGPGHLGAEFGAPADPTNPYAAARPEWYFLFLFQFLKLFEGHGASGEFFGAIVVPGIVIGIMFLMPLVGRWKLGHVFNVGYLFALLVGIGWLTYSAYMEDHRANGSRRNSLPSSTATSRIFCGAAAAIRKRSKRCQVMIRKNWLTLPASGKNTTRSASRKIISKP